MIALLVTILILAFIDYYAFKALQVVFKKKKQRTKGWIKKVYWGGTAILVLLIAIQIIPFHHSPLRTFLRQLSVTWAGLNYLSKLLLFLFVFVDDLKRLGVWLSKKYVQRKKKQNESEAITRSEFLARTGMLVATTPFAAIGWGISSGAYDYRVIHQKVAFKNLPSKFDGIKIAQLSDIHSGSFFNKTAVQGGVDLLQQQKPDLVFFTGDLVNEESKEVEEYFSIFNKVKAPLGVYSILGNHDYGDYRRWSSPAEKQKNMEAMLAAHRALGWRLLRNEHLNIALEGEQIDLIGVENWGKGRFSKYGDLQKAYEGCSSDFKILLSHDPSHWDAQIRQEFKDVDLTLSGHTHGAQFGIEIGNIKWSPSQYMYKQWAGLYQETGQSLYVNRGYGFLGFPGRVGMAPEITVLELVRG